MAKKYKGFKGSGMQPKYVNKKEKNKIISKLFNDYIAYKYEESLDIRNKKEN